jgi:hypothetical protein
MLSLATAYGADIVLFSTAGGGTVTNTITNTITTTNLNLLKTGQTNSYATGDDGELRAGRVWPNPRFTVQANTNCVLDNATGLVWARDTNIFGKTNWVAALSCCDSLDYGGRTDWRLPNVVELESLLDVRNVNPMIPSSHPFFNIGVGDYTWSSTTYINVASNAFNIRLSNGTKTYISYTTLYCVWPVSGPD